MTEEKISSDILEIFFLYIMKNVCCVFSLGLPHQGNTNEYTKHTMYHYSKED